MSTPASAPVPIALILASASPRRRELLSRVGIPLEVRATEVPEVGPGDGIPGLEVSRINARRKAEALASLPENELPAGRLILAADTEVVLDGEALGKPATPEAASLMLKRLSGRSHTVITAFALMRSGQTGGLFREVCTEVCFKPLSDAEISGYIATHEPFDKAGGYGIQGVGAFLVKEIRGSYTNVVGLPLVEVLEALAELGGPLPFAAPSA